MRNTFIGFLFLVAIWIGWGAPVPGVAVRPMEPSDRVPTREQALADRAEIERAAEAGQLPQEESLRVMRQRVVDAASRLEAAPCDKAARRELRAASTVLLKEQLRRVRAGKDGEIVTVDGRTVDASGYFNREVAEITGEAMFQGVLRPSDLPFGPRVAAQMAPIAEAGMQGRFVCEAEGQR